MRKLVFFLALFSGFWTYAQTRGIDSLKLRLKKNTREDTVKVIDLNELGWQYLDYSVDSSGKYVAAALQLSQKLDYLNGIVEAKNTQGILFRYANEPQKAIKLYDEVIEIRIKQGRHDRLTGAYANLGSVYYQANDYAKALRYYLKAFDNASKFNQSDNEIALLNNIGAVYKSSGLTDLAVETFKKGLEINKARKDEYQEAMLYLNIATVYDQQGLFQESAKYDKYAYEIFKKMGSIRQMSVVLNNLSLSLRHIKDYKGTEAVLKEMQEVADYLKEDAYYASLYQSRSKYFSDLNKDTDALREINRSLTVTDTINERQVYASRLLLKSDVCQNLKNYPEALRYYERGLSIVMELGDKFQIANAYLSKSELSQAMGDFKTALRYFQRADSMNESLRTDELKTKMATLNSLNELDKKENELALSIKEKETMEVKNKRQSELLIGAFVIGILIVGLLIFSVRAYRVKKKDNELLNIQKHEIEDQKSLLEEKQKEILDSIYYAQRIQKTLLANHELINRNLKENFILFKPKDIVSGDFYWAAEKNNCFYIAVCDSTGHGVPGAFMSLLNISFLNEAINEKNITAPHEILNHVRQKLISSISQGGGQDGMDCILLCFDKAANTITYAAAQNRPVLVRDGQLIEFPSDKMPVGKGENLNSFTLHTIAPVKGDMLYVYSDGYADQFGGTKGKKLKYKLLHEHLLKNSELPLAEQAEVLDTVFTDWKGSLEQVDDVLLMGIRL